MENNLTYLIGKKVVDFKVNLWAPRDFEQSIIFDSGDTLSLHSKSFIPPNFEKFRNSAHQFYQQETHLVDIALMEKMRAIVWKFESYKHQYTGFVYLDEYTGFEIALRNGYYRVYPDIPEGYFDCSKPVEKKWSNS